MFKLTKLYTIGGLVIETIQEDLTFCDQGSLNTSTIIESPFVNQYTYSWTVYLNELEINSITGYSNNILLNDEGNYSLDLIVSDTECSSDNLQTTIVVHESPSKLFALLLPIQQ